jgi:hypothetical protein
MERHVNRRGPDAVADLLRREAAGERPLFSEALHERVVRRLPVMAGEPTPIRLVERRPQRAGRSAGRQLVLTAAGAALVAAAIAVIAVRPDRAGGQLRSVALVAVDQTGGNEVAGEGGSADAADLEIERVPMFDDLEAGVREGVSTLAATLLDVPEWRMLADFDAAGFLGADSAP